MKQQKETVGYAVRDAGLIIERNDGGLQVRFDRHSAQVSDLVDLAITFAFITFIACSMMPSRPLGSSTGYVFAGVTVAIGLLIVWPVLAVLLNVFASRAVSIWIDPPSASVRRLGWRIGFWRRRWEIRHVVAASMDADYFFQVRGKAGLFLHLTPAYDKFTIANELSRSLAKFSYHPEARFGEPLQVFLPALVPKDAAREIAMRINETLREGRDAAADSVSATRGE